MHPTWICRVHLLDLFVFEIITMLNYLDLLLGLITIILFPRDYVSPTKVSTKSSFCNIFYEVGVCSISYVLVVTS